MQVAAAMLLWFATPAGLAGMWWWVLRTQRLSPAMRNGLASGAAAACLVTVVLGTVGLLRVLDHEDGADWSSWRIPGLLVVACCFAIAAGWACCTLYLALRCHLKGQWGSLRCPTAMHVAIAWVIVLALIVLYTEGIEALAEARAAVAEAGDAD